MGFIWAPALVLLLVLPLGVLAYLSIDRRRRVSAARSGFGTLGPAAAPTGKRGSRWGVRLRTRIPAAMFLVGVALLLVALARPQGVVSLPRSEGTVVLAYDVSGSMAAKDIQPTRMDAAKAATEAFV